MVGYQPTLPMKALSALIAEQPFLEGLPSEYLPYFNQCASKVHFRAHQRIFEIGHDATRFYLILSGEVAVETAYIAGKGVDTVQTLHHGEALGWSWLYPPYAWQFNARAATDVEAIAFDAERLRQLASEHKDFGYLLAIRMGYVLAERLQNTRARLLNLCEVA